MTMKKLYSSPDFRLILNQTEFCVSITASTGNDIPNFSEGTITDTFGPDPDISEGTE